jgi:ATP-binding cassette subfamily C (CFTR/MRP) protein 1
MIIAGNRASFAMFLDAWSRVMRSPTSWHDRTPVSDQLSEIHPHAQWT